MDAKVLVMGATFKEDVSDIRNSKVVDVIKELESFSCNVEVVDPHASSDELFEEYGFRLVSEMGNDYDAVIIAVNHEEYSSKTEQDFKNLMIGGAGVLVDIKGIYKHQFKELDYWSL